MKRVNELASLHYCTNEF